MLGIGEKHERHRAGKEDKVCASGMGKGKKWGRFSEANVGTTTRYRGKKAQWKRKVRSRKTQIQHGGEGVIQSNKNY